MAGKYEAKIEVGSNDPSKPSLNTRYSKYRGYPHPYCTPLALNFGRVEVGTKAQLPVVLKEHWKCRSLSFRNFL